MKFFNKLFSEWCYKENIKKMHNGALQAYNKGFILLRMRKSEDQ